MSGPVHEAGTPPGAYSPHVEFVGLAPGSATATPPAGLRKQFRAAAEGVYPQDVLGRMASDGYNPVIIGYSHSSPLELPPIEHKLTELQEASEEPLSVVQEMDPRQVEWIKQFLALEVEFEAEGTINSCPPRSDEADRMAAYRKQLNSNHGEHVALWCLEHGLSVASIEHPDVQQWIRQDNHDEAEDKFSWIGGRAPRTFHTAIRRDIHGLGLIEEHRPDVISVGYLHGLKYDMLLNRDGQRSFYYMSLPIKWAEIMEHWKDAHTGWQYYGPRLGHRSET